MNCLIVDDINLVGESIKIKLLSLGYDAREVNFYHYKIDDDLHINNKNIFQLLVQNKIEFLILDRGLSKIIEDDEFVYSSSLECDNKRKLQCDTLLFGRSNDGLIDIINKNNYILKNILVYTYDPFTPKIIEVLKKLKKDIENKLPKTNIYTIETSTIFRKPKNLKLYPENFTSHPNNDKNTFCESTKRIISTKKIFVEYSDLISDLIDDIVKFKNKQINSYTNTKNLDFEEFVINFNSLNLTPFKLASVAFLHNDSINEDYVLDFPYRSYYEKLNNKIIEEDYLKLFLDKDKKYLFDSWIYYDYNYTDTEFNLYNTSYNNVLNIDYIEKWLPILNSSIFHENSKWNIDKIVKVKSKPNHSIRLIFYFSKIKTLYLDGHINLTFFHESEDSYLESYIENSIIPIIKSILGFIKTKSSEYIIPKFQEQIQTQATRAAISQVLARNMSHNIGSHVMNALVNTKYLEKFCSKKHSLKSYQPTIDFDNQEDHKIFNQIAIYNNYVKCRMDYLADITFGVPAMLSSINVYQDLFLPLDRVRLLLDNISGRSDQFIYNIKFKKDSKVINNSTDFSVTMPNDVLGCQAFYNIIENVIRNTAKHAKAPAEQIINFTVNFRNIALNEVDKIDGLKSCYQSYYCVEIYDDIKIKDIYELIKNQNEKINDPVLTNENVLRSTSLGMVEMDASAAYIRQMDIVNIDNTDYDVSHDENLYSEKGNLNIIKAFAKEDKYLGYRFFIKKPQEVLIVTENTVENANDLINEGILIENKDTFIENLNKNHIYNYNFIVIECPENDNISSIIANKEANITKRIFYKSSEKIRTLISIDKSKIIEEVWKWQEQELQKQFTFNNLKDNETPNSIKIGDRGIGFDSHFDVLKDNESNKNEDPDQIWDRLVSNKFYYESLSSKGESKLPNYFKILSILQNNHYKLKDYISYLKNKNGNDFLKQRSMVIESILSRIIVIDERIQEKLDEKLYDITYFKHYDMSRINVPKKDEIDLKGDIICLDNINNFIDTKLKEMPSCKKYDFILIHYSILERIYEQLVKEEKEKMTKAGWVNEQLSKMAEQCNVVVTSGRGNIKDLPHNVRFVNLSIVTTALIEIKSKYLIHNILYSSRKQN